MGEGNIDKFCINSIWCFSFREKDGDYLNFITNEAFIWRGNRRW